MSKIPEMFFYNDKLHKYIEFVRSDDRYVAFCYQEEETLWIPRVHLRKYYKKAFKINEAAKMMRVPSRTLYELIKLKLVPPPEQAYDTANYRPGQKYINENHMLEYRQAAWDALPKNRLGIPSNDTMVNESELINLIQTGDPREFMIDEDGDVIKIYRSW